MTWTGRGRAYREAVRAEPTHANSHNNLGLALWDRRRGRRGGRRLTGGDPTCADSRRPPRQPRPAAGLVATGDPNGAVAAYAQAIRLDPADAATHNSLGGIYRERQDFPAALRHLKESIRLDPRAVGPRLQLANVQRLTGDVPGALATSRGRSARAAERRSPERTPAPL